MNLDFLKDISLVESPAKQTRTHTSVEHVPTNGADFRLFKDGKVYPSAEVTDGHNLEYVEKDAEVVGNGYDIIDTNNFPNYPEGQPRLVMVALTSKANPKVDLFGSVGYEEDGTPKKSVLNQGSSTTGKWLIELLEEVYGDELFPEGVRYVDLVINKEFGMTNANNIYHMPKTVTRGEKKGEVTYVRRTSTTLWPLTIMTLEDTVEEVVEEVEVEEVNFDHVTI
jgi:5-hydroxyisourate hydrolase-like protein (transthyretin family)